MHSTKGGTDLTQIASLQSSLIPETHKVLWSMTSGSVNMGICRLTLFLEGTAESSGQEAGDQSLEEAHCQRWVDSYLTWEFPQGRF